MVDIVATPAWKSVRILERDEVALGGYGGNMNEQATALVARTEFLNKGKADRSDIVQGQYSFSTLADFNAVKATLPPNIVVIINEAGSNQGSNTWNGTTLTKSAYDPLTQAKEDATTKADNAKSEAIVAAGLESQTIAQNALSMIGEQPLRVLDVTTNTTAGFYNVVGTWTVSSNYSTSDFIEVKKGDCILLHYPNYFSNAFSLVTLFDADKNFDATLRRSRINDLSTIGSDNSSNLQVTVDEHKRNQNVGVIIPADGFIKITRPLNINNAENDTSSFFAAVVTKSTLVDSTFTANIPKDLIKKLEWFTPKIDKNLASNGLLILRPIAVGSTQTYSTIGDLNQQTNISTKIPVKKGQFFHFVGSAAGSAIVASVIDSNDVVLQTLDVVSPFSIYTTGGSNPRGHFNVEITSDGFLVVAVNNAVNALSLTAITDSPVTNLESYYSYAKKGDNLEQYSELAPKLWDNIHSLQAYGFRNTDTILSGVGYMLSPLNTASLVRGNKQILLKKGEVLAFTNKTVMPIFARVLTVGEPIVSGIARILNDPQKSLLSTVIMDNFIAWANSGFTADSAPTWLNNAQESTNYICNEDYDLIIELYTGNSTNESGFASSETSSIDVISIDSYKKIRQQKVIDGLKTGLLSQSNNLKTGQIYSENVLVFKEELVSFYSNATRFNVLATSGYSDNEFISTLYAIGYFGFDNKYENVDLNYTDYVSRNYSSTVKINVTSLLNISFINFYTVSGVWSKEQTYGASDLKIVFDIFDLKQEFKNRIKLPATYIPRQALRLASDANGELISLLSSTNSDTKSAFVKKGKYYKLFGMGMANAYFSPVSSQNNSRAVFRPLVSTGVTTNKYLASQCFYADEDGLVFWQTATGTRLSATDDIFSNIAQEDWFLKDHFEHEIYEISKQEYEQETLAYKSSFLDLPDDGTVNFNLLSRVGGSEVDSLLQVRIGESVVATVKAITANQGQSSLLYPKRNINFEFMTDDGEDLYLRIGGNIEEPEFVAKSYYGSDQSHLADSSSADIWHSLRTFKPYPNEGVIPKFVLDNTSYDMSRHKARGTTFGIPLEIYANGKFLGVYTLRDKKKRANYAMKKNNTNHILLQADYTLGGGGMPFSAMKFSSSEVRNPSMSGYDDGATTLPNATVQADIQRIFDFMKDAISSPELFDEQGKDYIDFNSWYDYTIHNELVRNWDGQGNNYLVGTWDSKVWHVFPYDMDHTISVQNLSPYGMYLTTLASLYSTSAPLSRAKFLNRYKEMRDIGVISMESMTKVLEKHFNKINTLAFEEDNPRWGTRTLPDYQQINFMIDWFYKRIRYIDAAWGYLPSDSIVLRTIDVPSMPADGTRNYTYTDTSAQVGDVLKVEHGDLPLGMTVTADCTVEGTVVVTYTNTTSESINPNASFIRVYKES